MSRKLRLIDSERVALIALLEADAQLRNGIPLYFRSACQAHLRRDERMLKGAIEKRLGLKPRALDKSHTINVDTWSVFENAS